MPLSVFNVTEGFGELNAPLIEDWPGVQELSVNAGYRYSSYSTAGAANSYSYGAQWQPIADLRFRATYERAERAPNILEVFTPTSFGTFPGADPCAGSTSGRCADVVNAGTARLDCPDNFCISLGGGNTGLKPEIGETRLFGVVLSPMALNGFTATVDYFNTRVDGFIGSVDPLLTLGGCYGADATAATEAISCPLVHRNAEGQLYAGGYVSAQATNTGFLATKGFDVEANYAWSMSDWGVADAGSFDLNLVGTWLDNLVTETLPGEGSYDCAGLFGAICGEPAPRWRHRLRLTWTSPSDVALSLAWRHTSRVVLDVNTTNPTFESVCGGLCDDAPDGHISAFDYFDLSADWPVRPGLDLRGGVTNVLGREPPIVGSLEFSPSGPPPVSNIDTYPGTYDALGRTFFVAMTLKY
jgi:outer membrane receptor protein involved in Fe transport